MTSTTTTMTAKEFFNKQFIYSGDWVTFKLTEGDKTFIEIGSIHFPWHDEDQEIVFICNEELEGFEQDGAPIRRDLIVERLGDAHWKDEQDEEEAREHYQTAVDGWNTYINR